MSMAARSQQGMTILEVILALAIFSIAALALLNSLTAQVSFTGHFRDTLIANWVADNALAEQRLVPQSTENTKAEQEISMAGQTWFLRQNVSQDEAQRLLTSLEVRADANASAPLLTLDGFSLPPEKK